MISMLKGEVIQATTGSVTVMVSGVGYHVHVPAGLDQSTPVGEELTLYTMLLFRQDSLTLYGFSDPRQREIFSLLLEVSGIGPKTAMTILSSIEPRRFLEEVVSENSAYLMGLPGIGKKSAQRIVLELKERISRQLKIMPRVKTGDFGEDAVAALMTLGYSEAQARKAVGSVAADSVEELVRRSLRELI
ncbi:MAG TPA: Holliday junction branch migration protein RuvA [Deltaproteobacteria bacterium]|nr:Holliday junction branch migration protein RuvA [Deltaproteobacteria bacterium]